MSGITGLANHARILRSVHKESALLTEERSDGLLYHEDLVFARNCITDFRNDPSHLLAEVREKPQVRIPWVNKSARKIAFAAADGLNLPKRTRAMVKRYIGQTPEISTEADKKWGLKHPIMWVRWVDDGPAAPWFKNHRLVWENLQLFSELVRLRSLEEFRRRMADEHGAGLTNPFDTLDARDWWVTQIVRAGWPKEDFDRAIALISNTPYITKENPPDVA